MVTKFQKCAKFRSQLGKEKINSRVVKLRKGLQILPSMFTLGNAFFGFCSIVFAAEGELIAAAYCIFLGAIMDSLDGQIARMTKTSSDFGLQLDSLSDVLTFCMAPSFLLYSWQLYKMGFLGIFASSILLLFGVMRLAKFNITANNQTQYFIGVPTPVVACFLSSIVLNFGGTCIHFYGRMALLLLIIAMSCLMVSSVRIPTFKHISKGWYAALIAGLVSIAFVFSLVKTLLVFFAVYFFVVLVKIILACLGAILARNHHDDAALLEHFISEKHN